MITTMITMMITMKCKCFRTSICTCGHSTVAERGRGRGNHTTRTSAASHRSTRAHSTQHPHHNHKEGKDPMSVEFHKKLCGWLLDWNTSDGVFGHYFLVMTWNMSCHAHNTANIQLCEIEWSSTFDAFEIYFAHMKMDQTGDKAKYSHHLYSNPCCPLICPVLVLAFYFSCCGNLPQNGQSWLFPGCNQYQQFSEMLSHLIWDHEAEVSELGVNPKMIGTHSIRKGAVTYMSSSW